MDTFTDTAGWQDRSYELLSYFTDTSADNLSGFGLRFTLSSSSPADYAMIDDVSISTVTDGWGSQSFWGVTATSIEDQRYMFLGGTSMATPVAAGSAAIVRQWLASQGITDPSAALMKAVLINTAHDMYPGQYGTGRYLEVPRRPNGVEGWGRVDLSRLLVPSGDWRIHTFDYPVGSGMTTTGQRALDFEVLDHDPLVATLVWTDYPASPGASTDIVNQLEMSVVGPAGRTYYPNGMDRPDLVNNVQQVEIQDPVTGIYRLTVKGHNVPEGALPAGDQPYALVISGGVPRRPVQGRLFPDRGISCSMSHGTSGMDDALVFLLLPALLAGMGHLLFRRDDGA
ncbi:MAG: S8 family serine peptidase [Deltaproteobacteria bacterium]|nr:S8 family serine peptidase [Deltaproteobacteria bacterium]